MPVDYEVLGLQAVIPRFLFFVVFYMTWFPGRCLRRSRLSVARLGAASLRAERTATDKRRRGSAPVPLLVASREWIRPVHFDVIQGWLIRRLFEVWMHFTLEVLQWRRLHPLSYPYTVQTSLIR